MSVQMELDRIRKEIKMDTKIKVLTVSIKLDYNESDKKFWFFCNELPCYGYGRTFEKAYDAMSTATFSYIQSLKDGDNWDHVCDFFNLDPGICWTPTLDGATIKVVERKLEVVYSNTPVDLPKEGPTPGEVYQAVMDINDRLEEEARGHTSTNLDCTTAEL